MAFRDKLYCRLKNTPPYTLEHETLKINFSTFDKILKKNIRSARKVYYESYFERYKDDMHKTWSTINHILNKSKKKKLFPEVFKEDGRPIMAISEKLHIANRCNLYFTKIGTNLAKKIISPEN